MTIVSYRGPGCPGGVSGALSRAFENYCDDDERWWHLSANHLLLRRSGSLRSACAISNEITEGHYRYCNNFLWPVLHDLSKLAVFSELDWARYQQFNLAVAHNIRQEEERFSSKSFFVQDYQMALTLPILFHAGNGGSNSVFWHVPWPKSVDRAHINMLSEIAIALLSAKQIGFHTEEYANNFTNFIEANIPGFQICQKLDAVEITSRNGFTSKVVVQPLGLDAHYWKSLLEERPSSAPTTPELDLPVDCEFVLSVDRVDYTKGVWERLQAIEAFFVKYPEWQSKISFVQVGQRARPGLAKFDNYWDKCIQLTEKINSSFSREAWKPIVWLDEPVSPRMLARLYCDANAMLVSPLRDGLNLTAKEFVACAGEKAGTLLLSEGAGVWHEFADHVIQVRPENRVEMANAIHSAISIPLEERKRKSRELKKLLQKNSLSAWWQKFAEPQPFTRGVHHQLWKVSPQRELSAV